MDTSVRRIRQGRFYLVSKRMAINHFLQILNVAKRSALLYKHLYLQVTECWPIADQMVPEAELGMASKVKQ